LLLYANFPFYQKSICLAVGLWYRFLSRNRVRAVVALPLLKTWCVWEISRIIMIAWNNTGMWIISQCILDKSIYRTIIYSWCEQPFSQTSCFDSALVIYSIFADVCHCKPLNSNQNIFWIVYNGCHVTINRIFNRCMRMIVVWWDWIPWRLKMSSVGLFIETFFEARWCVSWFPLSEIQI
jgi:hypothetical protein